jgi:hypothetical protein
VRATAATNKYDPLCSITVEIISYHDHRKFPILGAYVHVLKVTCAQEYIVRIPDPLFRLHIHLTRCLYYAFSARELWLDVRATCIRVIRGEPEFAYSADAIISARAARAAITR